jgi:hypothetical protein
VLQHHAQRVRGATTRSGSIGALKKGDLDLYRIYERGALIAESELYQNDGGFTGAVCTSAARFRTLALCGLRLAALGSLLASEKLETLVNAPASFSAATLQQPAAVRSEQTPGELAEKTISCAAAKTAYFQA